MRPDQEERVGCVYGAPTTEVPENVLHENVEVRARIYLPVLQEFGPLDAIDDEDLLTLVPQIQAALKGKQDPSGGSEETMGVWFYRVVSVTPQPAERWVEATIIGWEKSPFMADA